eukprot:IDg8472t1
MVEDMGCVAAVEALSEERTIRSGPLELLVRVSRKPSDGLVCVNLHAQSPPAQGAGEPLCLHWGIVREPRDDRSIYIRPPDALFPPGTDPRHGEPSVQTPFQNRVLEFAISQRDLPAGIVFLVFIKGERGFRGQWFKGERGGSFYIDLAAALLPKENERRTRTLLDAERQRMQAEREEAERRERAEAQREALRRSERDAREERDKQALQYLQEQLNAKHMAHGHCSRSAT